MARNIFQLLGDWLSGGSSNEREPAKTADVVPANVLEHKIYNPLSARRGDTLNIANLPIIPAGTNLEITEIDEYQRSIAGLFFYFTDYLCVWQNDKGEDEWLTLRMIPREGNPKEVDCLILKKDWEQGYDNPDTAHLKDVEIPTGVYRVKDPEDRRKTLCTYHRCDGLGGTPFDVTVREVKVNSDEITSYRAQYWDFVRPLSDEDGGGQEFFFIEGEFDWLDEESMRNSVGQMRGYVARTINVGDITRIPTAAAREATEVSL